MTFKDKLHESAEYQALAGDQQQDQEPETVPEAAGPVLQLEKTDLQFWMQVLTVLLLFLIWRELARENGAAVAQVANGGVPT
jgi:hypothetical protein